MDLGFETIGNATVICHDRGPSLATDPWLDGSVYFGSWTLSHRIPEAQMEAIKACRYIWISHGHPDHLHLPSLERLRDKEILLPDHVGGRIAQCLRQAGFNVRVLEDGVWTNLSDRLRVASMADYLQDAMLFIDLGGNLVVDANDANDRGAGEFLRTEAARFERSFLLWLTGYGDADMINFFDESGQRVLPAAAHKQPVGPDIAAALEAYGIKSFVPSSSMHRYQRTDSAWANEYTTPIWAHAEGFSSASAEILPAFIRYDLRAGTYERIDPPRNPDQLHEPQEFGDNWSDELEAADVDRIQKYFQRISHLKRFLGFLNFRVGGRDHHISINPELGRGITFENPRSSLMTVIENRAFDDLLIGNFMRTTLHGDWGGRQGGAALQPDFSPFVARLGDNGGAYSQEELRDYFSQLKRRRFFDFGPGPAGEAAARSMGRYVSQGRE